MLATPGRSPRQLSPFHPDKPSSENSIISSSSAALLQSNPAKKSRPTVLDEDTYVASIEKIIERDFFPDIPKLQDRLDWLEAVRTGDPIQIKDAQLKIQERRRKGTTATSMATATPIQTPGSDFLSTLLPSDRTPSLQPDFSIGDANDDSHPAVDESLGLDAFFRRYTSEDNDSFSKILEKVNRKRKERCEYLTEGEKGSETGTASIEGPKKDRITDGFGTSDQPLSTLEGWKYTSKNLLMYDSATLHEAPLTDSERADRIKGLTKEIDRINTRFHGNLIDYNRPKGDESVAILYTPVAGTTPASSWPFPDREAERLKKYDLEDLRKTPNRGGYSFVRTPSPAPGVDESPFITWGEIEGTPLRLESEETPMGILGSGDGPHFKIPCPPSRDLRAHKLSRDAARKLREKSKIFQKPPLPSPARSRTMSPTVRTLSPAAQKFVRNAIAKSSCTFDETLRASYRGASPAIGGTPKTSLRSSSRFGREESLGSRSPSVREGSTNPL